MSADETQMPPDLAAAEAARRYHASQLTVIRERVLAVRAGEDADDLHKFRVAIRRTRSALDQLPGVLPEESAHFSDEFRWVQNSTGAARDADVYMGRMRDYVRALPKRLAAALDPIRAALRRRRSAAYDDVRAVLDDPRYAALVADWEEFLANIRAETCPPDGARPIREVAARAIWKAWKRVRKRGKGVTEDTPVRDVHRLRIACKKLRYLLEMFRPLYGDAELRTLIRPLKRLQDDLGDFHDLDVQQGLLEALVADVADAHAGAPDTEVALRALTDELQRRQRLKLSSFADEFDALTSAAPRAHARRLFKPEREASGLAG